MNTLPALLLKLGTKNASRETQCLCELFDAYRSNCDDQIELMGKKLQMLADKLTRYEQE